MINSLFFKNQAGKYHLKGTVTKQQTVNFTDNETLIHIGGYRD